MRQTRDDYKRIKYYFEYAREIAIIIAYLSLACVFVFFVNILYDYYLEKPYKRDTDQTQNYFVNYNDQNGETQNDK